MSVISTIGKIGASILKYIGMLISCLVGILFIISAYSGLCSPEQSAEIALLGLGFPILLLITILSLIIWAACGKWKMVILEIIFLLICFYPIHAFSPFNLTSKRVSENDSTIKVLTYNVMNFDTHNYDPETGNDKALKYILEQDADIVMLQEGSSNVKMDKIKPLKELLPELNEKYPYRDKSKRDLIILSKRPYKIVNERITENAPNKSVAYRIKMDGFELYVINVHLESLKFNDKDRDFYRGITDITKSPQNLNETTLRDFKNTLLNKTAQAFRLRSAQAEDIRKYINTLGDANVILCGDFNDTPFSYAQRTIMGTDMTDVYKECAFGPTITFHANRFYFRIDHMLYKGRNLEAVDIERGDIKYSDHYPLVATFKIH